MYVFMLNDVETHGCRKPGDFLVVWNFWVSQGLIQYDLIIGSIFEKPICYTQNMNQSMVRFQRFLDDYWRYGWFTIWGSRNEMLKHPVFRGLNLMAIFIIDKFNRYSLLQVFKVWYLRPLLRNLERSSNPFNMAEIRHRNAQNSDITDCYVRIRFVLGWKNSNASTNKQK